MIDNTVVAALGDERLDWKFHAAPAGAHGLTVRQWLDTEPTVADLDTPVPVLESEALQHNIMAMARWCGGNGVALAPHGKTTMAPQLWRQQLAAGAWGITLANVPQLRVARAFGVSRVFVANEVVSTAAVTWLADWVEHGASVTCLVDSLAGVDAMDRALQNRGVVLDVCVEVGGEGGRAGVRDVATAVQVSQAVKATPRLRLTGVAGYEGTVAHGSGDEAITAVARFLERMRHAHAEMDYDTQTPLVSAGGSAYFDQVVHELGPLAEGSATVLLRSGSYAIHDDARYAQASPSARGRSGPTLRPVLRLFATVLSRPEPGRAIVDVGRRDVADDSGFPVLLDYPKCYVDELNDQHAFVAGDVSRLNVGNVVRVGISHPCTTIDKWSLIPVVDEQNRIVDAVRTFF